jgi:hypothetical protein
MFMPEVVEALAGDSHFAPQGWQVGRVPERNGPRAPTITADQAAELRETKEKLRSILEA